MLLYINYSSSLILCIIYYCFCQAVTVFFVAGLQLSCKVLIIIIIIIIIIMKSALLITVNVTKWVGIGKHTIQQKL